MSPSQPGARGGLKKIAVDSGVIAGDEWVTVPAARIREALEAARDEGYDFHENSV